MFFPINVGAFFFPPRKARAAHGPEARIPAKKGRYPPPTRALFKLPPPPLPLPQSLYVRVDVRWRHNQIFLDG